MGNREQTIEPCSQKAQSHINSALRAMGQLLAMKYSFHQAKHRFNQEPTVPRPALTNFDRHAVVFVGPHAKPAVCQTDCLTILPRYHIAKFLITDVRRKPLPFNDLTPLIDHPCQLHTVSVYDFGTGIR